MVGSLSKHDRGVCHLFSKADTLKMCPPLQDVHCLQSIIVFCLAYISFLENSALVTFLSKSSCHSWPVSTGHTMLKKHIMVAMPCFVLTSASWKSAQNSFSRCSLVCASESDCECLSKNTGVVAYFLGKTLYTVVSGLADPHSSGHAPSWQGVHMVPKYLAENDTAPTPHLLLSH